MKQVEEIVGPDERSDIRVLVIPASRCAYAGYLLAGAAHARRLVRRDDHAHGKFQPAGDPVFLELTDNAAAELSLDQAAQQPGAEALQGGGSHFGAVGFQPVQNEVVALHPPTDLQPPVLRCKRAVLQCVSGELIHRQPERNALCTFQRKVRSTENQTAGCVLPVGLELGAKKF